MNHVPLRHKPAVVWARTSEMLERRYLAARVRVHVGRSSVWGRAKKGEALSMCVVKVQVCVAVGVHGVGSGAARAVWAGVWYAGRQQRHPVNHR